MSDELEPTAGGAASQAPATTTLSPDAPRLPDAVPGEVPSAAPTQPVAEPPAVELDGPATTEKSGTPVGFFVLMLLIVGAIAVIGAIVRPWESSEDPATEVIDEPATTSAPASTSPPIETTATTVAAAEPAPTAPAATTTLVVGTLPPPPNSAAAPDVFGAGTERCNTEQQTLSIAVEAFAAQTGANPVDPDALVESGLLKPDPDGWSSRWTFATSDAGITVVPVVGGACDL